MTVRRDIITLGKILIDFTPIKSPSGKIGFEQNAGGAPANVMAAITKLGLKTGFIGCVGEDGCAVRRGEWYEKVGGINVKAVDTTGAGDSHLGAMLYQIIIQEEELKDIPFETLLKFAKFANYMAAYVTIQFGNAEIVPTYDQVNGAVNKGSWDALQ